MKGRLIIVGLMAGLLFVGARASADDVKTERLGEQLWRVRVRRAGAAWPESGLNRYGIIEPLPVLETGSKVDFGKIRPAWKHTVKGFELKFPLARGERVYGLGDASRAGIQRRPGTYEMYVKNVNSYIPIPMAWTSRSWGVLVNTTWLTRFDVGQTDPDAMTVVAPQGEIDFYVFTGRDAAALLDTYTRLTGRPSMLPIWGYGFTFVCNQYVDQFELLHEAQTFREKELPCDVLGLEPGWMEKFYDFSTHKRWDATRFFFPYWAPKGAITFPFAMKRLGFKLSLWLCCNYDLFRYEEELVKAKGATSANGVALSSAGDTWRDEHIEGRKAADGKRRGPPPAKVAGAYAGDPEPWKYAEGERPWFEHLRQFVDQGAEAFKLDGACQVSPWAGKPNRTWSNGMDDGEAHNLYTIVYDKQMSRGFENHTKRRAMVYSAGGYVGVQKYVATWAGDTGGGVKPLISVLNLGLTGHPNQSCDMDVRRPDASGIHFGFLMPWSQQNNWDYWDQIWINPKHKVDAFRAYAELRYRLVPYLYSTAAHAARTGWPIARALPLVYPDNAAYANCTNTYFLGDHLLVGVYSPEVEIPPGTWYEWRTDTPVTGPVRLPVEPTLDWGGALYVRAGAVIPMWPKRQYLEKGWNEEVVCHVWPGADGSFELYEDDGTTLDYRRGKGARTLLTLRTEKGFLFDSTVFTVGPRRGSYTGMPATRKFSVVCHTPDGLKTVDLGPVGASGASCEL